MPKVNDNELDFDSMTEEELEAYLDEKEGVGQSRQSPEVEQVETEEAEDGGAESANVEQPENEVQDDTPETGEDNDESSEESEESPFYRGKKREDLIKTIEHGTKKISSQENSINQLKKELEELKANQQTILTQQSTQKPQSEEDDYTDLYDSDDLKAIDKLVEKKLRQIEEQKQTQSQQQIKMNAQNNELEWASIESSLTVLDPKMAGDLKESLLKEMQVNGAENTIQQPNWVREFAITSLQRLRNSTDTTRKRNDGLIERKRNATSVGSGSVVASDNSLKGKPEPDDPELYVKWLAQNQGIKI
jgi:hypothetical protein